MTESYTPSLYHPTDNQEIERLEAEERLRCWTYGLAGDPKFGKFYTERDAIDKASQMAKVEGFAVPIAVWDGNEEPVYVFIMGEQFRRV